MKTDQINKIIQKIKDFELINNGISEAFIDVFGVKIKGNKIVCNISVYDDDFLVKNVYKNIVYPKSFTINTSIFE